MIRRYHTVDSANFCLPMVRRSIHRLRDLLGALSESDEALDLMQQISAGIDVSNNSLFLKLISFFDILQDLRHEGVILRDLRMGLVDFPARHRGQDIFLCWKEGEPSVQYWHPKDAGFRGRRPISDLR